MPLQSLHPHHRPPQRFADRIAAGRQLGRELLAEGLVTHQDDDTVVLGLPRGGVPVAAEVARVLGAPLDVLVVRKLGHPHQPELAMGALAPDDARVLNAEIAAAVSSDAFERVVQQERAELERRQQRYRGPAPLPLLRRKRVVLVDDGVATGATMRAAIASVRKQSPARIIVAVPVGPADSLAQLAREPRLHRAQTSTPKQPHPCPSTQRPAVQSRHLPLQVPHRRGPCKSSPHLNLA